MTTEITSHITAAWTNIKTEAETAFDENGERIVSDAQIALVEPGVKLLELSLIYHEAHQEWFEAQTLAEEALGKPRHIWAHAKARLDAAKSALELAKNHLLSAAIHTSKTINPHRE